MATINKLNLNQLKLQTLTKSTWQNDNNQLKSEFYSIIGDIYHNLNKHESSDSAYDKALFYNENNVFVLNNYSYYLSLREQKLSLAKNMTKKCDELTQKSPVASFIDTYAWVLYKLHEYDLAKIQMERAIKLDGDNPTLLDHYGDILYKLNLIGEALNQWQKALSLDPSNKLLEEKIKAHE